MSAGHLWDLASAVLDGVDAYFTTGWDLARFLQASAALVTISSGSFAIYQAYRFAERRLSHRLLEFLEHEEQRLRKTRRLAAAVRRDNIRIHASLGPIFLNQALTKSLRDWKSGQIGKAETALKEALGLTERRIETAKRAIEVHENQKAAAHLLLGAIADAKQNHPVALEHFEEALKLNPEDVEALEYAGLELLRTGNPLLALEYFQELEKKATTLQNRVLVVRSLCLQAKACVALPQPRYVEANQILKRVPKDILDTLPAIERARVFEDHGDVRRKLSYQNALESYQNAINICVLVSTNGDKTDAEAREILERVAKKIAEMNETAPEFPLLALN